MPLIVKNFTWTQTNRCINIRVPIPAVNREKVDLFTADSYIKAHFSPYLFEVFLLQDVDNSKSKCVIKEDLIVFDLEKKEDGDWECLEKDLTKKDKMELRNEIHMKCQEQAKQESEDRRIKKSQMDRYAVQQAMDLETKQHNLMDSRRDYERNKAMDDLEKWKNSLHSPRALTTNDSSGVKIIELEDDGSEKKEIQNDEGIVEKDQDDGGEKKDEAEVRGDKDKGKGREEKENIVGRETKGLEGKMVSKDKCINEKKPHQITKSTNAKCVKTPVKSEYVEKKKDELKKRVLPRMRKTGQVEITHTPRTFPTPSRESTADEEQAWLKNITLARRATGFVSEDLRPEEQDPQWCKEKGDEFFRNGNFLGAISAYSHGITLSDKLPSLYANRSATHFALGNFNKCLNDCSAALDLMRPACESNRRSRAKCIARRAAALARVGYLNKAIDEMKAAAKLMPDDETIKKDIYDMERAWEQNPDSD